MEKLEKLYTVADIAERYGVKNSTVYGWVNAGMIRAICINSSVIRVTESALADFEKSHEKKVSNAGN